MVDKLTITAKDAAGRAGISTLRFNSLAKEKGIEPLFHKNGMPVYNIEDADKVTMIESKEVAIVEPKEKSETEKELEQIDADIEKQRKINELKQLQGVEERLNQRERELDKRIEEANKEIEKANSIIESKNSKLAKDIEDFEAYKRGEIKTLKTLAATYKRKVIESMGPTFDKLKLVKKKMVYYEKDIKPVMEQFDDLYTDVRHIKEMVATKSSFFKVNREAARDIKRIANLMSMGKDQYGDEIMDYRREVDERHKLMATEIGMEPFQYKGGKIELEDKDEL